MMREFFNDQFLIPAALLSIQLFVSCGSEVDKQHFALSNMSRNYVLITWM